MIVTLTSVIGCKELTEYNGYPRWNMTVGHTLFHYDEHSNQNWIEWNNVRTTGVRAERP